jgi:hypothetical protein
MRQLLVLVLLLGAGCVERSKVPTQAGSTTPPPAATTTAATSGTRSAPCPTPKPDVICTKEYRPVVCDGCEYANACIAGAAGFKAEQCVLKAAEDAKKSCPTPSPNFICPMEYAPVKCDGCLYPNACTAGAAGFTKEQCAPALGED